MSATFFYFAYGSNLLARRIHINNPSAKRAGIGKLENYKLDFITFSNRWKGASATIVPAKGCSVWGAIWEINNDDLESLDKQEGVADKIYFPFEVSVQLIGGGSKTCRVYQQCVTPPHTSNIQDLSLDRQPSTVYLNTMIQGAKESLLPEEYQKFLKSIPSNGYNGEVDIGLRLAEK